jgi:exodeoxyribonuclease VII small subunit
MTPTRRPDTMSDETPKYGEAIDELEEILEEIEAEDVDLDDLADKVERASDLVELCRQKLDRTEVQVQSIIEDLESDEEDSS